MELSDAGRLRDRGLPMPSRDDHAVGDLVCSAANSAPLDGEGEDGTGMPRERASFRLSASEQELADKLGVSTLRSRQGADDDEFCFSRGA